MRTKIAVLVLLSGFLAVPGTAAAQQDGQAPLQAPESIEEAQEFGFNILRQLPDAVREVWDTQVVPLWNAMWNWVKSIWDSTIFPWLQGIWERILAVFGQEIEKRKPFIEEEFQQEKEQLRQEIEERIPEEGKTLWERIKGLFGTDEGE